MRSVQLTGDYGPMDLEWRRQHRLTFEPDAPWWRRWEALAHDLQMRACWAILRSGSSEFSRATRRQALSEARLLAARAQRAKDRQSEALRRSIEEAAG